MEPVQVETAFSRLLKSSAAMQKHGVAIGAVSGLLAAAVGTVWFASRVQARNEQAILEVQHKVKEEKLQRKVEGERLRRDMLQRVVDMSYHADWQGPRERVA
eukprot:XP_001698837.1 predicted protein [Chlamydomonas reinhardtii]